MSKLDELAGKRDQILLAEIAGLLHNIGKLDPNFLKQQIKEEERKTASESIQEQQQTIEPYHFKRFAAPEFVLFQKAMDSVIFQRGENPSSVIAFWEELRNLNVWTDAERVTLQKLHDADWSGERRSEYPVLSKTLTSIWQVFVWLQGKGSLYIPRSVERKRLEQEIETLNAQRAELNHQVQESPTEKKPAIGRELGQVNGCLKERQGELARVKQQEKNTQDQLEAAFRQIRMSLDDREWSIANLLTFFWDEFFYQPDPKEDPDSDYKRDPVLGRWLKDDWFTSLPTLLILSHGEVSGAEKFWARSESVDVEKQHWPPDYFATAFGYDHAKLDVWHLQSHRFDLVEAALAACAAPSKERNGFVDTTREILEMGLGDTQWPINEINLWDYASTIAALFKSGVARAALTGEIPTVGDMHWRFLSLRFDGLGYLNQAHHVTDLLGRRETLTAALDAAQKLLEEEYPLGNQVYRDENGVVFVVPDVPGQNILDLTDEEGNTLKVLLERAFAKAEERENKGAALAGELTPDLRVGRKVRGKQLKLGNYLSAETRPLTANAAQMADWWRGEQAEGKEICTVCGARPVGWGVDRLYTRKSGYYREQADRRKVCGVCLKRRGRRAQEWSTTGLDATIWTDEVADANGRFALIVGRFGLEGWLDGSLIPTMQKPASFARVRRCWETTRGFWTEVEKNIVPTAVTRWQGENGPYQKKWPRLVIKVENKKDLSKKLGAYHTYETVLNGRQVSLVWDAKHHDLISAENLRYLGQQLGLNKMIWQAGNDDELLKELKQRLEKASPLSLYEPSEYSQAAKPLEGVEAKVERVDVGDPRYTPHIPLLTEPALFMALVPAARAMKVVQAIKEKYEREMSKVRDRLPLHLGLVIAPRRTPLRAALEAGQAMLNRDEGPGARNWQKWQVTEQPQEKTAAEAPDYLTEGNQHFEKWWDVPLKKNGREIHLRIGAVMGDGETKDQWYPHLLTREPKAEGENFGDQPWKRPAELGEGNEVWIAPSTFDFEFLDTTARRFEIVYQTSKVSETLEVYRPSRPTRPYLLEEIETLQQVWDLISDRLSTTQWMALNGLIEQRRDEWSEPRRTRKEYSKAFKRFVKDALLNAEWKRRPDKKELKLLKSAATEGVLNDVIDLYHEAIKEKGED